jgi:hypothetical protein
MNWLDKMEKIMNKETAFALGMFIGGIIGILCHAYITGTLFVQ